MKKYIYILPIICMLITASAVAGLIGRAGSPGGGNSPGGGASCDTDSDEVIIDLNQGTETSYLNDAYTCTRVALTADVTEYIFRMCWVTDTDTITASLFADVGDEPAGAAIAGTSKSLAPGAGSECATFGDLTFTLAATKEGLDGTYWICLIEDGGAAIRMTYEADAGERVCYGAGIGSFSCADNNAFSVDIMGCP